MSNKIQTALIGAMHDISTRGIAKLEKNTQQGYHFRGIEAAMNELSPILVKHGITVTPAYSDLQVTERSKGDWKALRFASIKGKFTFGADDGSSVSSEVYGEAMDSGDKAIVKAQSVAFRTALFQQFVVPTMAMDPEAYEDQEPAEDPALDNARAASLGGAKSLQAWWESVDKRTRVTLAKHLPALKLAAAMADKESNEAA